MTNLLYKMRDPIFEDKNAWKDDIFERKAEGERLERLLRNSSGAIVIALRAPWGAGKSIFLKRWIAHVENDQNDPMPVVFVDAWANDYLDDPMNALVVAVNQRLNKTIVQKAIELVPNLINAGAKLVAPVARIAAAVMSYGVSEATIRAAEAIEPFADAMLKTSESHHSAQADFMKTLIEIRQALVGSKSKTPLVFVIDELDRCRPDFAMKMLERIKHFFNIPNLVFVIATDGENLPNAVKTLYGTQVDGERYLRKFFDFEFRLSEPSPEAVATSLILRSGLLDDQLDVNTLNEYRNGWRTGQPQSCHGDGLSFALVIEALIDFIPLMKLSLRDAIQVTTALVSVYKSSANKFDSLSIPLAFCICLRFCHEESYSKIHSRKIGLSEFLLTKTPKIFLRTGIAEPESADHFFQDKGYAIQYLSQYQGFGKLNSEKFIESKNHNKESFRQQKTVSEPEKCFQRFILVTGKHLDPNLDTRVADLLSVAGSFIGK